MDTTTVARDMAHQLPQAMLPCPFCAASVRGENFASHLDRKHAGAQSGRTSWVGRDRRVRRPLLVLLVVALAGAVYLLLTEGDAQPIVAFATPGLIAVIIVLMLGLIGAGVVSTGLLKARLSVTEGAVTLRYALGMRRRQVRLPARLEVGGLLRVVGGGNDSGSSGTPRMELPAGTYLAVISGRRRLTVGCPVSTELRRHWAGWQQGKKRKAWDVTIRAADFVAFQYALHQQELLRPRT